MLAEEFEPYSQHRPGYALRIGSRYAESAPSPIELTSKCNQVYL